MLCENSKEKNGNSIFGELFKKFLSCQKTLFGPLGVNQGQYNFLERIYVNVFLL